MLNTHKPIVTATISIISRLSMEIEFSYHLEHVCTNITATASLKIDSLFNIVFTLSSIFFLIWLTQ